MYAAYLLVALSCISQCMGNTRYVEISPSPTFLSVGATHSKHVSGPNEGTRSSRRRSGGSPAPLPELEVTEKDAIQPELPSESGVATLESFKNMEGETEVPSSHVEVQRPPSLYDTYEKSLLHFTSDLSGQPNKAVLYLKKLADGKNIGAKCPTDSIKLFLAETPETPVTGPLPVHIEGEEIETDITPLFDSNLANGVDVADFWLIMDTDPDCYFAFDVEEKPVVKFEFQSSLGSSLGKRSYAGLIISGAGIAVLLLVFAMFKMRKENTDYTYFYDSGQNDVVMAT